VLASIHSSLWRAANPSINHMSPRENMSAQPV